MIELSDEDLMHRIRSKSDHGAFSILVERHADKYRSLAYRYTNNVSDAEDVVQDAFIKLWANPEIYQSDKGAKFSTWFYRVVTNQCLDRKRKKKPRAFHEFEDFEDKSSPQDDALFEQQRLQAVETAMLELRPEMQTALNLGFYEGLPRAEAAEVMDMHVDAFKSLLRRSKLALKDAVELQLITTQKTNKQKVMHYGT